MVSNWCGTPVGLMAPRYGGGTSSARGLSPKRVIVRIVPAQTYSWDHRKLSAGVYLRLAQRTAEP